MFRFLVSQALLIGLLASTPLSLALAAESQFISDLKEVYLTQEAKDKAVIGIEIELNGLTQGKIQDLIVEHFGGDVDGEFIRGTSLGDIRVYFDGELWQYQDWARQFNGGRSNRLRRAWASLKENLTAPHEIVFPPLPYEKIADIERLTASLKEAGATGSTVFSPAATQVNLQVDPNDVDYLKRLSANYLRNGEAFHDHYNPSWSRRSYIRPADPDYVKKLIDYDYSPDQQSFWIDFRGGVHIKFSRLNIGPALLENDVFTNAEKEWFIKDGWGKRPAAEWREADTLFEEGYLTDQVDVSIALHECSKTNGQLNAPDLRLDAIDIQNGDLPRSRKVKPGTEIFDVELDHTLKGVIREENFVRIKIKANTGAKTSFVDVHFLQQLRLLIEGEHDLEEVKRRLADQFSFEVVRPDEKAADVGAIEGKEVIALAYDDGYLGRGDGRASWLFEVELPGVGTYDVGDKGGGPTLYVIPQESIDAGFHIGEKDGYLSLDEAIRTLQHARILEAVGIESERVMAIIETGKETGMNLDPPDIQPTAKLLRAFETGLRGAHLRMYEGEELQRVARFLRQREAFRLGRQDIPPLDTYLRNKIARDARRAAVAKHFWIVHGAINPANIYEGGWADLNYVEALRVPDGEYTPLNVYSRLEFQHHEFYRTTVQFVDALSKADPSISIDTKGIYYEAFEHEMARLELMSAGLTSKQAETVIKADPALAQEYVKLVWKINFEYLLSDTREMKKVIAKALVLGAGARVAPELEVDVRGYLAKMTRDGSYEADRVYSEEMFPMDRFKYKAKQMWKSLTGQNRNRQRAIGPATFNQVAGVTYRIAELAAKKSGLALEWLLKAMGSRAGLANSIDLPNPHEIAEDYRRYRESGMTLEEAIEESSKRIEKSARNIRDSYGDVKTATRGVKAPVKKLVFPSPSDAEKRSAGGGCGRSFGG